MVAGARDAPGALTVTIVIPLGLVGVGACCDDEDMLGWATSAGASAQALRIKLPSATSRAGFMLGQNSILRWRMMTLSANPIDSIIVIKELPP